MSDVYEKLVKAIDGLEVSELSSRQPMLENVLHPNHYTRGGIECIEAIKASMTLDNFRAYCKGNVLKYIWRYENKNGEEDLRKAEQYLKWMIESFREV